MKQSVRRIGLVAGREFLAAVMNKGFVIEGRRTDGPGAAQPPE